MGKKFKRSHQAFRTFHPRPNEKESAESTEQRELSFVPPQAMPNERSDRRSSDRIDQISTTITPSKEPNQKKDPFIHKPNTQPKRSHMLSFVDQESELEPFQGLATFLPKQHLSAHDSKVPVAHKVIYDDKVQISLPVITISSLEPKAKNIIVNLNDTIENLIEKAKYEFNELKRNESCLFIKNGLIIPNELRFGELIEGKVRSSKQPNELLFDVQKDKTFWTVQDSQKTRGIIVGKEWYKQNKTIFPYSNWTMFSFDA